MPEAARRSKDYQQNRTRKITSALARTPVGIDPQLLATLSESSNSLQLDYDVPAWAIDALLDMRTAARPKDRFAE